MGDENFHPLQETGVGLIHIYMVTYYIKTIRFSISKSQNNSKIVS